MEAPDPQDLRISDADRDKVAEVLREAAGEGRIDLTELDERLEATYAARTYRDLVPITIDLGTPHTPGHVPGHPPGRAPGQTPVVRGHSTPDVRHGAQPPASAGAHATSFAIMSDTKRLGPWVVGEVHTATALMGSVTLDLREAHLPREVLINANAVMGSVQVIVDAQTAVRVEGVGVMGTFSETRPKVAADVGPDSPVVRVRGLALMGSVEVRRKGPPGELRRRLLGH